MLHHILWYYNRGTYWQLPSFVSLFILSSVVPSSSLSSRLIDKLPSLISDFIVWTNASWMYSEKDCWYISHTIFSAWCWFFVSLTFSLIVIIVSSELLSLPFPVFGDSDEVVVSGAKLSTFLYVLDMVQLYPFRTIWYVCILGRIPSATFQFKTLRNMLDSKDRILA